MYITFTHMKLYFGTQSIKLWNEVWREQFNRHKKDTMDISRYHMYMLTKPQEMPEDSDVANFLADVFYDKGVSQVPVYVSFINSARVTFYVLTSPGEAWTVVRSTAEDVFTEVDWSTPQMELLYDKLKAFREGEYRSQSQVEKSMYTLAEKRKA